MALENKLLDTIYGKGTASQCTPIAREYDGQAHYFSKAANSLVNLLKDTNFSSFALADQNELTRDIHALIVKIEERQT